MPIYYGFMDPTYVLVIIGAVICMAASANVKSTYAKYNRVFSQRGVTANDVAEMILRQSGIIGVRIEHVSGELSDHYDPRTDIVRLSDSTFGQRSIAAIGVAAHECGHVIQHHEGYMPIKLRNAIVPVVNFGSALSWPVILFGIIFGYIGLIKIGIILFALTLVFQVVTLPVEFDASRRAIRILGDSGILGDAELSGAKKVLGAAAMTYVAGALSTLLQLLRLVLLFGRRSDD